MEIKINYYKKWITICFQYAQNIWRNSMARRALGQFTGTKTVSFVSPMLLKFYY